MSNGRPIGAPTPFMSRYSPVWEMPGGRPFSWYPAGSQQPELRIVLALIPPIGRSKLVTAIGLCDPPDPALFPGTRDPIVRRVARWPGF